MTSRVLGCFCKRSRTRCLWYWIHSDANTAVFGHNTDCLFHKSSEQFWAFRRTISNNRWSLSLQKNDTRNDREQKVDGGNYSAPKVIFVLGGPGSGKGTQCELIVKTFGFTHLSAGELLREEIKSGSENGAMIQSMIKEGKIVPSSVTVQLLQNAICKSGKDKFLIDGFPRNDENRITFELLTDIKPDFVLFFDCNEEEMERRLLQRNQGRIDDNIAIIRKRFKVFEESSLPVIKHYESLGKLHKINGARKREDVFNSVKHLFLPPSNPDS